MAVLKFKDELGAWHSIPAIQGASAYEQAQTAGYQGSLEDFYADLQALESAKTDAEDAQTAAEAARDLAEGYAAQLAAGVASPAGTYADLAALIAANPDHAKTYITLDDGKWCYYDTGTSAFVAGGVYQATAIADGSVTPAMLNLAYNGDYAVTNADGYVANKYVNSSTGVLTTLADYHVSQYIPVTPGEYISVTLSVSHMAAFYNDAYAFIEGLAGPGTPEQPYTFTVPLTATIAYMRVNINAKVIILANHHIVRGQNYDQKITYVPWAAVDSALASYTDADENIASTNVKDALTEVGSSIAAIAPIYRKTDYTGMTVLVTGDSITDPVGTATIKWYSYLIDYFGITIKNDGKSSTGLIRANGGIPGIYTRIDTWDATYGEFDAIILMGNMNDGGLGPTAFPVGSFTDTDPEDSQYGALHSTIQKLLTNYPNKPILWIISTPRLSSPYPSPHNGAAWGVNGWFDPYCQAIIAVCNHYSIPYLDLYHASGLRPWVSANNTAYFYNADGVHPNNTGHEWMAKRIKPFVAQHIPVRYGTIPIFNGVNWEAGTIALGDTTTTYPSFTARGRFVSTLFVPCTAGRFEVVNSSRHNLSLYQFTSNSNTTHLSGVTPSWLTSASVVPGCNYIQIAMKNMDGTDFTAGELAEMSSYLNYYAS